MYSAPCGGLAQLGFASIALYAAVVMMKIFVYNVENVVKVRTGETDYDALQDEER